MSFLHIQCTANELVIRLSDSTWVDISSVSSCSSQCIIYSASLLSNVCWRHLSLLSVWVSQLVSRKIHADHLSGKLEMFGILTAVRDFTKSRGKYLARERWPKTVYCNCIFAFMWVFSTIQLVLCFNHVFIIMKSLCHISSLTITLVPAWCECEYHSTWVGVLLIVREFQCLESGRPAFGQCQYHH